MLWPDLPGGGSLLKRQQLCSAPIHGNPATDTAGIAAVTGPGGALLYLVDAQQQPGHWEINLSGTARSTGLAQPD
ncbi:MAG: hypothetical protein R3E89_07355 [Thiolinea sp.]